MGLQIGKVNSVQIKVLLLLMALTLTDAEILSVAQSFSSNPDKVIVMRVEELGPVVRLNLSPIPWEGGTDIVLRVRVLDKRSPVRVSVATY